jgi:hypothetical protein
MMVSGMYMMQATGCVTPFLAESAATATDFCFIFDCQNGLFGGTLDPCSRQTANGEVADPFFADCPPAP